MTEEKNNKIEEINKEELWQSVLGELEVSISPANFKTWFSNTFILRFENNGETVVIGVPNVFTEQWLSQKYHKAILDAFQNITDNKIKEIVYTIKAALPPQERFLDNLIKIKANDNEGTFKTDKHGLNPRYTFESFIVGKGNELAHAAAIAVSKQPGKKYNPLFIYGGVGLGKTHLLQAIGHRVLAKNPKTKVRYVNAEVFTNEFIEGIRTGQNDNFKNKYRQLDFLLVDDIQFMAGKERTEEEFFHTFDWLHQGGKQIVITSDRPPKSLPALEKRIISRFEWGLICDITPPDFETRLAILKTKSKEKGYKLEDDVLNYLASHIQNNVRELEGALNKIFAWHELKGGPINLDVVEKIIKSLNQIQKGSVKSDKIIQEVSEFYNLTPLDLKSASRKKELVMSRQIAMYLLREDLNLSFPAIGKIIGGRDHSTTMHGWEKVKKEVEEGGETKQDIDSIRQRIYTHK